MKNPAVSAAGFFTRDFNDDLAKNPFDYEFKQIVICFGRLLREIIETINKHGLKQRYLNKHKMDVKNFFATILETDFTSDLAIQYQKRIRKNRYKLFTFMDYVIISALFLIEKEK